MRRSIEYIDGEPVESDDNSARLEFVAVTWQQMRAFHYLMPGASQLWMVYAAIIGLCQMMGTDTVEIWPKWYEQSGLNRKAFSRHVKTLESAGVITVERPNGKPMRITLDDSVPLRLSEGQKR